MPTAGMSKSGAIETRHEMVGVILVTLALLFVLSLLSYSPRDPLLFQDSLYTEQTSNLIGKVGMTLGTGAFRLIGGASYLLPLALAVLGGRCFVRGSIQITVLSAIGFTSLLFFLSTALALRLSGIPTVMSGWIYLGSGGGYVGRLLSELLITYCASVGAHIVVMAGMLLSVLVATPVSLLEFFKNTVEATATLRDWAAERWHHFRSRAIEKRPKAKAKPVKIIRAEPVPAVEEETIVTPEAAEVATVSTGRRRKKRTPVEETPEDLLTPQVVGGVWYVLPNPEILLSGPAAVVERVSDEDIRAQANVLVSVGGGHLRGAGRGGSARHAGSVGGGGHRFGEERRSQQHDFKHPVFGSTRRSEISDDRSEDA